MSSFECKVYKLTISEHPNADVIELAQVGDYRSIVKKGDFKTGDLGIYIPEAAVVPDWMLEEMGLTGKLAGKKGNRVKAIKLRGILSQGLIYPVKPLWEEGTPQLARYGQSYNIHKPTNFGWSMSVMEGDDVTEFLGIEKYEPVIPSSMDGEVFNAFGMTLKYDIENIKKFPDVIKDGEIVSFTEKLHGTWCCFGFHPDNDYPIVTSKGLSDKGLAFKFSEENLKKNVYVKMFESIGSEDEWLNILELFLEASGYCGLEEWEERNDNIPFYILGEIFGAGVQDLTYGLPKTFRIFDIYMGEPGKGRYLSADFVETTVTTMNVMSDDVSVEISYVPVLYKGPFSKEVLAEHTDGKETVSGKEAHMREGIVVRVETERRDDEIGRVILKSVSEKYLLRKNATEYT